MRPGIHFVSTCLVCLGAHFSAVWIVVANSWQQTPAGFHLMAHGSKTRAEITDFWGLVFNPSSMDRLVHVLLGAYLAVPAVLSVLAHDATDAEGTGLDAFAREDRPPVQVTFQAFHLMVALGLAMIALSGVGCWLWWRGRLESSDRRVRGFLWILVLAVILPQVASQAGWFAAEVGRQPWVVHGLLRTADGVSESVATHQVWFSLILVGVVYLLLFVLFLFLGALIFRAVAIEFRSKMPQRWWRRMWDVAFSAASVLGAFLLGVALGNIVWGLPLDARGVFGGTFWDLLHPYALWTGVTSVALFMMHGAIYLHLKTEGKLEERVRGWIRPCVIFFVVTYAILSLATLVYVPRAASAVPEHPWSFALVVLSVLAIANIPREAFHGRPGRAFLSSSATLVFLMMLFGVNAFPELVPSRPVAENGLDIYRAASSETTLRIMLIMAAIGMPLVVAYTASIYWIFRGKVRLTELSY